MILSLLVIGLRTGFRVRVLPFFTVTFDFRPVILDVATLEVCTLTVTVAFFPLFSVTVIFAVPFFTALIVPFLSTVAIFLLLEVQDFHGVTFRHSYFDCFCALFLLQSDGC